MCLLLEFRGTPPGSEQQAAGLAGRDVIPERGCLVGKSDPAERKNSVLGGLRGRSIPDIAVEAQDQCH